MLSTFLKMQTTLYRVILFVSVTMGLQSCDPPKILQIRTVDKPDYSVAIYANKNILPRKPENANEKIVLRFPSNDVPIKTDTTFYYGLGGWPGKDLMSEFAKNFDSIIIIRNGVKQSLTQHDAITKFLLEHRHGFANSTLTIEAK